jgi:hypothetical protein
MLSKSHWDSRLQGFNETVCSHAESFCRSTAPVMWQPDDIVQAERLSYAFYIECVRTIIREEMRYACDTLSRERHARSAPC